MRLLRLLRKARAGRRVTPFVLVEPHKHKRRSPSQPEPERDETLRAIIIGLFLTLLGAAGASAQGVTQDGIAFDDAKHRGWYVRFWTGSCKELRVVCLSGAPYWGEIMQRLLVNVPAEKRERLRSRLILLGQRIGYEWAKENDIRRIDNGHIKGWSSELQRSVADPEPAVSRIEHQARYLLGGTGDPRPSHALRR